MRAIYLHKLIIDSFIPIVLKKVIKVPSYFLSLSVSICYPYLVIPVLFTISITIIEKATNHNFSTPSPY